MKCNDCFYFSRLDKPIDSLGKCKRYPPTYINQTVYPAKDIKSSRYDSPTVHQDSCCGEYKESQIKKGDDLEQFLAQRY